MHNTQLVMETGSDSPLALPINPTRCLFCHALGCRNRCPLIPETLTLQSVSWTLLIIIERLSPEYCCEKEDERLSFKDI